MIVTALATITAVYATAFALAPLLQIRQVVAHRDSRQVSLAYYVTLAINLALWLAYGVALVNWAMIVPNTVALGVVILTALVIVRHRPARSQVPAT